MKNKERKARDKLDRFYDALINDLDKLTDEELLAEAEENGEDINLIATHTSKLISETVDKTGRKKMAAARAGYDVRRNQQGATVLQWSLDRKRALIREFAENDNTLQQKLTLAARNGEDTEADVDSFLEDLMDLGAIDDEGNTT